MEDKINKLQNKIAWHQKCVDKLQNTINILYAKGIQKRINQLLDSGIIGVAKWKFEYASGSKVRIHCQDDLAEKTINKIMGPVWGHEAIDIMPGVILKFDDEEVDLVFDNSKICKVFIADYGIKISVEKYKNQIKDLQEKINLIKKIVKLVE